MSEEISREEIAALLARGSDEMTTDEYWHTIAESYREKPQEPCEDAISRQAALDAIFNNAEKPADAYHAVRMLAPVTPKQRTGHWIEKDGFDGDVYYDCSECGESWTTIEGTPWQNGMRYCPNCGCRMVEPQESEISDADNNNITRMDRD